MEGHDDHAPGSVGDNYLSYVRDRFGYHYDAQEWMDREERGFLIELETRHAPEALDVYFEDLTRYDALQLVHLLHRHLRLSQESANERALGLIESCITRASYHGAVHYAELCEHGILMAIELDQKERAEQIFARCEALPNHTWTRAPFFRALLSWHRGDVALARETWLTDARDKQEGKALDLEKLYEAVEWLVRSAPASTERIEVAEELAALLREEAIRQGARDVVVDLELLEPFE